MDLTTSLRRFGTAFLSYEMMTETIGVGTPIVDDYGVFRGFDSLQHPNALSFGIWLAMCPAIYLEEAMEAVRELEAKHIFGKLEPARVSAIIAELQASVIHKIDAQKGDRKNQPR